jgi:SAM-dependent methyltransferase
MHDSHSAVSHGSIDALARAYDDVPYVGRPNATSHPEHLRVIATLYGLDAAPVFTCRVLEVGCGDGANLLPMAATFPDAMFVGCDVAAQPLARAGQMAGELGLANVRLLRQDFCSLPADLGTFDYVIAHGLYSWIRPEARAQLLPLIARRLAPRGVAFVSYNAYPGCHVRQAVWELLKHHTRNLSAWPAKLAAARELIALMAEPAPTHEAADEAIRGEFRQLVGRADALLCHDDLGEPNDPVYFHEFVADAKRSGLAFLAEADLSSIAGPELAPRVRDALAGMNGLAREQYLDFVRLRRYRESLLCHADTPFRTEIDSARAADLYAYASTRLLTFGLDAQPKSDADAYALKELLLACWPRAFSVAELSPWHMERNASGRDAGETVEALVIRLFAAASINLRFHAPAVATGGGALPVAFAPARCAVRDHDFLPNVYHEGVRIEAPAARRLLELLDGQHSRAELAAAVGGPYAGVLGGAQLEAALAGLASMAMLVA